MQYTKNYHLPQWVKEDRIMMEDFNAMNSSIESGLTTTAAQASTAVSTANAAKQGADNAYSPDNKPYVTGTYAGTGTTPQHIELGFRPSFVIMGYTQESMASSPSERITISGGSINTNNITFTDTGMQVVYVANSFPAVNVSGKLYNYIAFR